MSRHFDSIEVSTYLVKQLINHNIKTFQIQCSPLGFWKPSMCQEIVSFCTKIFKKNQTVQISFIDY